MTTNNGSNLQYYLLPCPQHMLRNAKKNFLVNLRVYLDLQFDMVHDSLIQWLNAGVVGFISLLANTEQKASIVFSLISSQEPVCATPKMNECSRHQFFPRNIRRGAEKCRALDMSKRSGRVAGSPH